MAKKQKRQAAAGARPQIATSPAAEIKLTDNSTSAPQTTASTLRSRPGEFNPDYSYVLRDLKRIAVLAGSFIFLLVVLSFFLR